MTFFFIKSTFCDHFCNFFYFLTYSLEFLSHNLTFLNLIFNFLSYKSKQSVWTPTPAL